MSMFGLPKLPVGAVFTFRWALLRRRRCPRARRLEGLERRQLLTGVTYQGGPVINNAAVETVFLGQAWTTDSSLAQNAAQLDQFFSYLTGSSYMDLLAQYGTAQAGPIGHGSFVGQVDIPQDVWRRATVSDGTIQNVLDSDISSGAIAAPNGDSLLFVFTPPNVVVSQGGSRSNGFPEGFAGYHNSFVDSAGQLVRYAVIPDPIGNDRVAGLAAFQQQTAASSHELAEAITDPDGTSWWDDTNDSTSGYEIGDFADLASNTVYLNGYAVEELWSNAVHGLAAPQGATPTATTPPPTTGGGTPTSTSNRGTVAESLVHSAQYDTTFVAAVYEHDLGREADAGGLNYWAGRMQLGLTDERFEASLLSSQEYAQLHGTTDISWLRGIYEDLLGRPADGQGLNYWLAQLQAGESRYEVALSIATSPECEAIVVLNDYQAFLGRSAASSEIAYWVNAFEHGAQNEDVIAGFISSSEYYSSSAKGQGNNTAWLDSVFNDLFQTPPTPSELTYWLGQLT
ncbi:MAG TPA: DUF4214 domain-containing protein [Pirellulales bacterium]|nr:DUF4214 domain-containing protein [Pirellulales bacterium]